MNLSPASRGVLGSVGTVLAGGLSAALFAVALVHAGTILVFLAYLSSLPLFMAGLGAGSIAGLIASAVGVGGLLLTEPSAYATSYAVLNALPAMMLIALALRHRTGEDQKVYWYPEGFLMVALTLYPCVVFLVIAGMMDQAGGLLALTTDALHETLDVVKPQMEPDVFLQFSSVIDRIAKFMPALAGCAWMVITMACMIIGQNILQKSKSNIRTSFALHELHVPTWLIFAIAATGLAGIYAPAPYDYFGLNLAIILGIPFFFVGLAVVHAWAATTSSPKLTLGVFYIMASIIIWSALLIAALGVIDQWGNFRQRFAVRPKRT